MTIGHHKFISTKCFFLSRAFQFPTCLPFVLVAVMSDSESIVEETKGDETPEIPKPQSSELVDEVFPLLKGYLNTQLDAKGKLIEIQSKIERSASEFKFKGNRKQLK